MSKSKKLTKPNIYEYIDYRAYLRDFYCFKKQKAPQSFSFRIFSKKAGVSAPNYLKLVMEGKRNLSDEMIPCFADAINLRDRQKDFFEVLVKFDQAKTSEQKDKYFKVLAKFREYRSATKITQEQYEYFSHWYYVAIREMISLSGFVESPKKIGEALKPKVDEAHVKKAVNLLLKLDLIKRDKKGNLQVTQKHVATEENITALSAYKFHQQMMQRGMEALEEEADQRFISSITLGLPAKRLPELNTKVFDFLHEVQTWLDELKEESDEIFQLNFQLFGLTQLSKKRRC